jgi:hypothetical protein
MNLQYNGNTKLNTRNDGVDVTGTFDASSTVYGGGFKSSLEQDSAGTGVDLHSSATIRAKEDSGVYKDDQLGTNYTTTNIENTNFRGSIMLTDDDGVSSVLSTTVIPIAYINLGAEATDNIYHSVDVHCCMQEKISPGEIGGNTPKKWLSQNLKASYNGDSVQFQTSDSRWMNKDISSNPSLSGPPGEFCAQKWDKNSPNGDFYMVISYCPYATTASTRTVTYSVNANGLSMPILEEG